MATKLQSVVADLETEQQRLSSAIADLDQKKKEHQAELRQIKSAVALLKRTSSDGKATPSQKKPSPNRQNVIDCITTVLTDKQVCHEEVLKEQVEELLAKQGLSKVGFALRFKEALATEHFTATSEGVRMSTE